MKFGIKGGRLLRVEKAVLCGLLIAAAASLFSGYAVTASQCDAIRGSVLRLHILANSDSAPDQKLKLQVRDKILAQSQELFGDAGNRAQAESDVRAHLAQLAAVAQREVYDEGYTYPVQAKLVHMYFTTRTYGSVTLPAGMYDAVRVTIGAAKGHNWWCVLFPPLCIPAAESGEKLGDVLEPGELRLVEGSGKQVVLKFKSVELCEEFAGFLRESGFLVRTSDFFGGVGKFFYSHGFRF